MIAEEIRERLRHDGFVPSGHGSTLVDGHQAWCGWCGAAVAAFELWKLEVRSREYPPTAVDGRLILFPCLHGQDPVPDGGAAIWFHRTAAL